MRSHHPEIRSLLASHTWKRRTPEKQKISLLIRLPTSIRCDTCGNHFCRGTNLKYWKVPVVDDAYRGISRFRLFFFCSKCFAKISLKAFPHDPNWVLESGVTTIREEEAAQEIGDGIKSLQLDEGDGDEDSEDEGDEDEDSEDEGDNALKKREFSVEFLDKPTDSLTEATTNWKDRGSSVRSLDRSGRKGSCSNLGQKYWDDILQKYWDDIFQ